MKNFKLKISKLNSGFTLIEFTVILAIVFLLVGTAIVEYSNFDDKAQRNADLVPLKAIADALNMYKLDNKGWPPICTALGGSSSIDILINYINLTSLKKTFKTGTIVLWSDGVSPRPCCVTGNLAKMGGTYSVKYCAETSEAGGGTDPESRKSANQPACKWDKGITFWHACTSGL